MLMIDDSSLYVASSVEELWINNRIIIMHDNSALLPKFESNREDYFKN